MMPDAKAARRSGLPGLLGRETPGSREVLCTQEAKPGVIFGDVERDGYKVLQSNEKAGEDAFAISADRRSFIVCDGLGSYGKSGVVARQLSEALLDRELLDEIFLMSGKTSNKIEVQPLSVLGRDVLADALRIIRADNAFRAATKIGSSTEDNTQGLTTLTILHQGDDRHWYSLVIGDSPLYYRFGQKKKWQGIGNNTIGDLGTDCLGIENGRIEMPIRLQITRLPADPTFQFVLATDWLSDNWEAISRDFAEVIVVQLEKELNTARSLKFYFDDPVNRTTKPFNAAYELLMRQKIDFFKTQCQVRDVFDPWVFSRVTDEQQLSELVRGEGPWWSVKDFKKPDDFTAILVDPSKL